MLNRVVFALILVPLAVLLIALAVANREWVTLVFDPFNRDNPALSLTLPFFVHILLSVAIGVLIGSAATWLRQRRYRVLAKEQSREVARLQSIINQRDERAARIASRPDALS